MKAFSNRYENRMVVLLCISVGVVFFDRNAINYLMPYIAPEMGLNNTQIGLLASGLSLAWALSGLGLSALIDATGHRRRWLVAMMLVFSLCSVASGLAAGFAALLIARVVMGLAEGPIVPVAQSIAALESSPQRRGLNMGIIQNLGAGLLGQLLAPVIVVGLANAYGWRTAFYVAGLPGIVLALCCWFGIREPRTHTGPVRLKNRAGFLELLRVRNVALCCIISCLMVSWLVLNWVFMPLYLVQELGMSSSEMSLLMAISGGAAAIFAVVAAALSDRYGRKPITVLFCLAGVLAPVSALVHAGSFGVTALLLFIGTAASGVFPLFMATIPSESLSSRQLGTSIALVVALGEIVGGVCAPLLGGWTADAYGLISPMLMQVVLAAAAAFTALLLTETAPRIVNSGAPLATHLEPS